VWRFMSLVLVLSVVACERSSPTAPLPTPNAFEAPATSGAIAAGRMADAYKAGCGALRSSLGEHNPANCSVASAGRTLHGGRKRSTALSSCAQAASGRRTRVLQFANRPNDSNTLDPAY
jgi:hypothetical protein